MSEKRFVAVSEIGCTYCLNGSDLPNAMAIEKCPTCLIPDARIDHVLVHEADADNIEAVSYERRFTDSFDIDGTQLPLSDHWGVSFEFAFDVQSGSSEDYSYASSSDDSSDLEDDERENQNGMVDN